MSARVSTDQVLRALRAVFVGAYLSDPVVTAEEDLDPAQEALLADSIGPTPCP